MKRFILSFLFTVVGVLAVNAQTQAEWQTFTSAGDKFTASFPCKPEVEAEPGDKDNAVFIGCAFEGLVYQISVLDMPPKANASVLQSFITGVEKGFGGKILYQKDFSAGSLSGTDFAIESEILVGEFRSFAIGRRIFTLNVAKQKAVAKKLELEKFYSSFKSNKR